MPTAIDLKHDRGTGVVTLTMTFDADEQVEKDGLQANVISNHLLGQAATLCSAAADVALRGVKAADLDADAVKRKADVDAEINPKKAIAAGLTSDVQANPVKK